MATEDEIAEFTSAFRNLTNSINATADSAEVAAAKKKAAEDLLVKSTVAAAAGMGNAAKGFIGAMAGGEGGAKSIGGFVDAAKNGVGALSGMAQSAVNTSKKFGPAGQIAAGLIIAAGKGMSDALLDASKFFLGEVDALGKTFNEFGQIGALGSKGMQGLVDDFKTSGLMMTSYKKIVAENTTTFANFKGSVKGGITEFVNLSHELTNPAGPGTQLRMLGMSLEQVGEAGASYIALQVKLGRAQTMANTDLTRGTIEYAKSMDEVAKLTGINKKTLEQEQQEALTANRFAAALELEKNVTVNAEMIAMQQQSRIFGTFYQQGITDLMSSKGAALTEAAKAAQLVFPGVGQLLAQLGKGKTSADIVTELQEREKLTRPSRASQITMLTESSKDFLGGGAGGTQFSDVRAGVEAGAFNKRQAQVQADALTTQTDKLTEDVVKSQQAFEGMYKAIQNEVINKLPLAASAIKTFADTANAVTKSMLGLIGSGPGLPNANAPGSENAPQNIQNNAAALRDRMQNGPAPLNLQPRSAAPAAPAATSAAPQNIQNNAAALTNMMQGGRQPLNLQSAAPSAPQTRGFAPAAVTTGKSLSGLDQGFAAALLAAATDYNSATGSKLQINSGFRDKAKQQAMFDKWVAGGRQGPVIGDPNLSRHVKGLAADIQNYNDPQAVAALNARGFNNTAIPGEPWHFQQAANGGILSGPRSGYSAMLHGTEAVVPLPDGRSIPVSNSGGGGSMEIQAAQLNALEELVSAMKNQVNISSKMLQYSQ